MNSRANSFAFYLFQEILYIKLINAILSKVCFLFERYLQIPNRKFNNLKCEKNGLIIEHGFP